MKPKPESKDKIDDLFSSFAMTSEPSDIVKIAYDKLSPNQKYLFNNIVETLRVEYAEHMDMVQLSMAALSSVIQISAMAHFVDVINGDNIRDMTEAEVEALDYARKIHNENFNNVIKNVDSGASTTSFLKELEEFKLKQNADGSIEFSAKAVPKLKLPKVIDVEPAKVDKEDKK